MVQSQSVEQLALFYAELDSETRIVVQQRTTEIKALMKRAASDIIEIGQKLIEVKARLEHGRFYGWLRAEFDWTPMTANRFMHVADRFKSNNLLDSFAPSALYLLAAPSAPDSARDEALDRAASGETITHQTAREIVSNHRPPRVIVAPQEDDDGEIDDALDPPMEPAQVADLRAGRIAGRIVEGDPIDPYTTVAMRFNGGMRSSDSPEWYTPQHIIDLVIELFDRIDLDPCSNSHETPNVPALAHYTAADDGLALPWHGRIYMNPPYGDEVTAWVNRIIQAYQDSEIAEGIALLPARIDTNWFQPLWDYPMCFIKGRLKFSGSENSAPFPSVLVYFGVDVERFCDVFEEIGRCGRLT